MNWARFESEPIHYAQLRWNPAWNKAEKVAMLDQNGNEVMVVTTMGTMRLDLDDTESVNAYVSQMQSALDLLKKTKEDYDKSKLEHTD